MYQFHCLNPIASKGLDIFDENYRKSDTMEDCNAILVRSAKMHDMQLPSTVSVIARAEDGVNNIPVKEFQDLIRDSEYAHINLMELKKQLKRQGYTICSTGRYDRTVHNSAMGKAEKVMSFSQKAITTLPELPETEAKE